ncbi:MAG: hypothetical protein LKF52_14130 [Butyrivibrio sp.]|nr:hypothetical protein [Butyrivibrio sp.]
MKRSVLKKMLTVLLVLTVCLSECMVSQASQKKTTSEAAFAAKLKRGWNLGNTLDATGSRDLLRSGFRCHGVTILTEKIRSIRNG